jgi:hypothetical protein
MRRFWLRTLKTVLPVALLCGAAGYLYAVVAGAYFATERDDGSTLRDALAWRLPFTMAVWGGGFTLLVEFFRHLWAPKNADEKATPAANPEADAEKLLLQLLEQAEEAERSRTFPVPEPRPLTDTPLPAGLPKSQPTQVG